MAGTPVICSDTCGSAGVVTASGLGCVFKRDDFTDLTQHLRGVMSGGRLADADRSRLRRWAKALGAEEGARYLLSVLGNRRETPLRPP